MNRKTQRRVAPLVASAGMIVVGFSLMSQREEMDSLEWMLSVLALTLCVVLFVLWVWDR